MTVNNTAYNFDINSNNYWNLSKQFTSVENEKAYSGNNNKIVSMCIKREIDNIAFLVPCAFSNCDIYTIFFFFTDKHIG